MEITSEAARPADPGSIRRGSLVNSVELVLDEERLARGVALVGRVFRDATRRGDVLRFEYDPAQEPACLKVDKQVRQLPPPFDVNPNPDKDVHVLALDDADPTPDTQTLVAQHAYFRLSEERAAQLVEEIRQAVAPWERIARGLGAAGAELSLMGAVISIAR